MKLIYNS